MSKTPTTDAVAFLAVTSKEPKAPMRELVEADVARELEKALRGFVDSIEEYGRSGVWPDNGTLRRLADEGRMVLGEDDSRMEGCMTNPPPCHP